MLVNHLKAMATLFLPLKYNFGGWAFDPPTNPGGRFAPSGGFATAKLVLRTTYPTHFQPFLDISDLWPNARALGHSREWVENGALRAQMVLRTTHLLISSHFQAFLGGGPSAELTF